MSSVHNCHIGERSTTDLNAVPCVHENHNSLGCDTPMLTSHSLCRMHVHNADDVMNVRLVQYTCSSLGGAEVVVGERES